MKWEKVMTKKTTKKVKKSANSSRIGDESVADSPQIRYAFVPLSQQFRRHTKKNDAKIWIPIECSLLIRYEFAALSPQTRYIFVAILLYCGMRGVDEIPLDTKFMASALIVDERTLKKSFDELLFSKLLLDREKEREKEKNTQTDRENASRVSVDSENLSEEEAEEKAEEKEVYKNEASSGNGSNENSKLSKFTIEECLRYVEKEIGDGATIQNPKALATKLFKTGEADSFIMARLYPDKQSEIDLQAFGEPRIFTDNPCSVCLGAKMADTDGAGYRKCEHCRNERGKATGLEPRGNF